MRDYYVPGEWNVLCQRCGFKYKASKLQREWTGLMVCCDCYETRHPQTLIRVPDDDPSTPWSSPEPTDTFLSTPSYITLETAENDSTPAFWILTESGGGLTTEN